MKNLLLLGALMTGLFAFSAQAAHADGHVKDTISVTGVGEVTAEPDQAKVMLSVSSVNRDVNQAKAEADRKYSGVIAAAKKQGIAKVDIKTSNISLQPEYQWQNNTQKLVGTRVSRSVTITVNDIERVANLLQDLVDNEVSTINNVQTGFKDRAALQRQALTAAIADAKEKAEFLATQFGKQLGSAYTISEQAHQPPVFQPFAHAAVAKSALAEVPEEHFGTQAVKARVSVIFHAQ